MLIIRAAQLTDSKAFNSADGSLPVLFAFAALWPAAAEFFN
jgi:hypothetical protein